MTLSPNQPFELAKSLWTDADFDVMGWHDVHIHAIAFSPKTEELLMDIDYMFAWVDPEPPEKHYSFWMSPCTLVFANAYDFKAKTDWGLGMEISHVSRQETEASKKVSPLGYPKHWEWTFDCQEGALSFLASGYQQFTRAKPVRSRTQIFSWQERKGVSFERTLCF